MTGLLICAAVVAGGAVPLLAWLISGEAGASYMTDDLICPRPTAETQEDAR